MKEKERERGREKKHVENFFLETCQSRKMEKEKKCRKVGRKRRNKCGMYIE